MGDLLMDGFLEPVKSLVYAEIIAKASGNPSDKFPDEEYLNDMEIKKFKFQSLSKEISKELKEKAIRVIQKIKVNKNMHLTVLWMESESYDEWTGYLDGIN